MQLQLNGRSSKPGAKREDTLLGTSNSSALGGLVTSYISSFSDNNFLSRLSSLNEAQITLLFRTDTFESCRKLTESLTMTMGSNADSSSTRSRFVLAEATANILLTAMANLIIRNGGSDNDSDGQGPYHSEQWRVLAEAYVVLALYCEERQMMTCLEQNRQNYREVLLSLSKQYGSQGQYQEARQVLEKALQLEAGTSSSLSIDRAVPMSEQQKLSLAATLNDLACFCMELQDFDVALCHYQTALNLQRQVLEEEHPTVIVTLQSMAKLYLRCGMYEATLQMFHYILLLLQKQQQQQMDNDDVNSSSSAAVNKQTEMATTLSSMGLVYYAIRDYTAALQYYRQALAIQCNYLQSDGDSTTGANDTTQNQFEIATTLNSIGMILCEVGDDDEARDTLQASLTKHLEISQKDTSRVNIREGTECEYATRRRRHDSAISAVLYNLAVVYMQKGEDENAINLFAQSIQFKRAVFGGRACPEMATNLQRLGGIHLERGEHKVAILYLEEALRMLKQSIQSCIGMEEEPAATKKALYHQLIIVGNVHLASGNVEGMMACMVEACRLIGSLDPVLRTGILTLDAYSLGRIHPRCAPAA